jgi:hypothetical protein
MRMKTAINHGDGADPRRRSFSATSHRGEAILPVRWSKVPDDALDAVRGVLKTGGFRIGRSRQAEYGRIEVVEARAEW